MLSHSLLFSYSFVIFYKLSLITTNHRADGLTELLLVSKSQPEWRQSTWSPLLYTKSSGSFLLPVPIISHLSTLKAFYPFKQYQGPRKHVTDYLS